jgi:hypothetical protein
MSKEIETTIQAVISVTKQTDIDDWDVFYYSKTFEKTASLQEIEDWAKTYNSKLTIFNVKFSIITK